MLAGLATRDRRALLLLAGGITFWLAWATAIRPYRAFRQDVRERLTSERELLARELTILGDSGAFVANLEATQGVLANVTEPFFREDNRSRAETAVTAHVQLIASLSGVVLRALETSGSRRVADRIETLRLVLRGEGAVGAVLVFLHRLETGAGRFTVSEITLEPSRAPDTDPLTFGLAVDAHVMLRERADTVGAPGPAVAQVEGAGS